MLLNSIVFILSIYVIFIIYIKIKYPFWSKQPVFHFHNIKYWFNPPGIIDHTLPKINKFYDNFIIFKKFSELSDLEIQDAIQLLQQNYLRSKTCNYIPTKSNVLSYFKNIETDAIMGLKYKTNYIQTTSHKKCIGIITGKPLQCYLDSKKITVNYVDYLCVHKKNRKQKVAPNLIYSYYVTQRNETSNPIFLFKRESAETMIVPLTTYLSYAFNISYLKTPKYDNVVKLNNIDFLYNTNIHLNFKCFVTTKYENLTYLIENNIIIVYALIYKNKKIAYYFFRDSCTNIDGEKIIDCFASISITTNQKFIYGFINSLIKIRKNYKCETILVENVANNNVLLEHLAKHYRPKFKTNSSYYFYNFAYLPIPSNQVCCIF